MSQAPRRDAHPAGPRGLTGDASTPGLARMFGISRSKAADLLTQGPGAVDGTPRRSPSGWSREHARGHLAAGQIPSRSAPRGGGRPDHPRRRLHRGPRQAVGVAVHPSMGWTGPTVVGTSGGRLPDRDRRSAPSAGIVQRLDVGTSGVMVIAKSERATRAEERVPEPDRRQDLSRHGPGPSRSARGHGRRTDRPGAEVGLEVHRARRRQAQRHPLPTLEAHRFASLLEVQLETGRTHRSAFTWRPSSTRVSATSPTGRIRPWPGGRARRQWLHAVRLGFEHPAPVTTSSRVDVPCGPRARPRGDPRCRLTPPRRSPTRSAPDGAGPGPRGGARRVRRRERRTRAPARDTHPGRGARLGRLVARHSRGELWLASRNDKLLGFFLLRGSWLSLLFVHPDRPARARAGH